MGAEYGVSLTVVGLFTTALFVTHTAVMIPGGQAIDRFGARRLCVLALLVILLGNGGGDDRERACPRHRRCGR